MFINRSEKSWGFLRHLLREAKRDKSEPAGWCLGLSIGDCICFITITVDDELCFGNPFSSNEDNEQWVKYWQLLIDDLSEAVESAMPNLERVFWMETAELEVQPRLLKAILQLSSSESGRLHELALADFKFSFHEEPDQIFASVPSGPMRLHSFALGDDDDCTDLNFSGSAAYLAETILRRSAPTLESCVWNSRLESSLPTEEFDLGDHRIWFRDGSIEFPKLRKFWAHVRGDMEPSVLESFLAAPLESFAPSAKLCSAIIGNNLVDKFPLPHLYTFAITTTEFDLEEEDYVEEVFSLARHYAQQIKELFIYAIGSVDELASHFSSDNFCNLRSLCFSWGRDPELRVLKATGQSVITLEELSFGFQPSNKKTGRELNVVDEYPRHDDIIAGISPLKNLARLTVFGDEYIADWCSSDWAWHRFFKEHVWFNQGRSYLYSEGHESKYADGIWGHNRPGYTEEDRTRFLVGCPKHPHPPSAVVDVARKYATVLPSIQGFVCGRVAVEIAPRKQS